MARAEYYERPCKSALNRVQGMAFKWSLNPYRGCVHECQYCFARPTHRFFELGVGNDFGRIIFVKTNLPIVLASELSKRTWRREQVAVGTATDPYQPIEGRYRLTRRSLEVFARFRTPVSLITKGTMIVRDLDVLQELSERAGASICFSVPTIDRDTWLRTEPLFELIEPLARPSKERARIDHVNLAVHVDARGQESLRTDTFRSLTEPVGLEYATDGQRDERDGDRDLQNDHRGPESTKFQAGARALAAHCVVQARPGDPQRRQHAHDCSA